MIQAHPVLSSVPATTEGRWSRTRRRLAGDPVAVVAGAILLTLLMAALCAPWIAPYDPLDTNLRLRGGAPNAHHWLGTDEQGRDILSRILYGSRMTVAISFTALLIGTLIGGATGILAAFYKRLENPLMRIVDVLLSFPAILLGLAVVSISGPGFTGIIIALAAGTTPLVARMARSVASTVVNQEYVTAGRAIGLTDGALIMHYVLRNCIPSILTYATLRFGQVIILAAAFSFLGLGVVPPAPELGAMISQGRSLIYHAPHVALVPGFVILLLVLSLNLIGDALRDILDPKLSD
jgi:ABC-type dipeptide/oligopeptide/nickel transport system permease subunit